MRRTVKNPIYPFSRITFSQALDGLKAGKKVEIVSGTDSAGARRILYTIFKQDEHYEVQKQNESGAGRRTKTQVQNIAATLEEIAAQIDYEYALYHVKLKIDKEADTLYPLPAYQRNYTPEEEAARQQHYQYMQEEEDKWKAGVTAGQIEVAIINWDGKVVWENGRNMHYPCVRYFRVKN